MQPNEQPEQHPIDYLDSISTVPKNSRKGTSDLLFLGGLIGLALLAIGFGAFMLFGSDSGNKNDIVTLSVRLSNLQSITDNSQKKIISSRLRATNTSLSLVLTNANRDITDTITANDIDLKTIDPVIISQESTDELTERLEDARLNAVYDRTYAREMTYQLSTTLILIEQLQTAAKRDSEKDFLSTTYNNLQPLQKQFSEFNSAN